LSSLQAEFFITCYFPARLELLSGSGLFPEEKLNRKEGIG
jgi:hypothetical protein